MTQIKPKSRALPKYPKDRDREWIKRLFAGRQIDVRAVRPKLSVRDHAFTPVTFTEVDNAPAKMVGESETLKPQRTVPGAVTVIESFRSIRIHGDILVREDWIRCVPVQYKTRKDILSRIEDERQLYRIIPTITCLARIQRVLTGNIAQYDIERNLFAHTLGVILC